jgi:hypothetical protein
VQYLRVFRFSAVRNEEQMPYQIAGHPGGSNGDELRRDRDSGLKPCIGVSQW